MLSTKPRIKVRQQNIYNRITGKYSFTLFYARWNDRIGTISTFVCGDTVTQYHQHQTEGFVTYIAFANKPLAENWQKYLYLRFGDIETDLRKINRFNSDLPGDKPKRGRWELKVSGLTFEQFGKLLELEVSTEPPTKNSFPVANDFKVDDRVKIKWTGLGADDWRIGEKGTVKRIDVKVNRIDITLDNSPYSLSLQPDWIVKLDPVQEALERGDFMVEVPKAEPTPEEVKPSNLRHRSDIDNMAQPEPTPEVVQPEEVTTVAPQEIQETQEINNQYLTGDVVEVASDRHGDSLVWELLTVTATDSKGVEVEFNSNKYYFLNDEVAPVKDSLFSPPPKPSYTFIASPSNTNLNQQYHCYENNKYLWKIDQLPISGKWILKNDRREFNSKEDAAIALKAKLEADKRLHDEMNKSMLNRFLSA